jgi:hypothetical protein
MSAPLSPGEASPLVYIAASARDAAAFEAVRRGLTEASISCAGARRDLPPETPFADAVKADISGSRLVVVIVSPRAVTSQFVVQEVRLAAEAGKPLIALVIDNVELSRALEYFLGKHLRLQAPGDLEVHLPVLVDAVRRCLAAGQPIAPPAGADPESLAREVIATYPTPIAFAYQRFRGEKSPDKQLSALLNALGATVRYLTTLAVADLLAGLALEEGAAARFPDRLEFEMLYRPAPEVLLDGWARLLRETARELSRRPRTFVPELLACCDPAADQFWDKTLRLAGELAKRQKRRDALSWESQQAFIANQYSIPDNYPEWLKDWEVAEEEDRAFLLDAQPRVDELLRRARFLCDYPLAFVAAPDAAGPEAVGELYRCMGSDFTRPPMREGPATTGHPIPGLPFVIAPGDRSLMYLWPLLTQRVSTETVCPKLYIFDNILDRGGEFLTAIRSTTFDSTEKWERRLHPGPAGSHVWLFERLHALPAVAPAPLGLGAALRGGRAAEPPPTARPRPTTADEEAFSSQTVVMRYPAPIAVAYRRFCQEQAATERLLKLFSCVEAVMRYLVTLGVCDLFQCLAASGRPDADLPDHKAFRFLKRPQNMQMGLWIEALRETARALAGMPVLVRELPGAANAGGRLLAVFDELVKRRNRCIHRGGLALDDGECVKLLPALRPKLDEALRLARFTCAYPLGFARGSLGQPAEPGRHRYYFHSCVGARVADTDNAHVAELPRPLAEDVPFVVTPDGARLMYLWPLLLQRVSGLTGRHTLYTFEGLPEDKWPFLTRVHAAAIDVDDVWPAELADKPSASLVWLFERLRQMPAVVDLPRELELAEELQPTRRGGLVGQRLKAGLTLRSALATGGFGTVYAATDADGRPVAVKVLEVPGARGELKRFEQEFAKLQRARHAGIIRCYEQGIAMIGKREYPWYSMELAVGDLSCRIDSRLKREAGALPWDDPAHRRAVLDEFAAVVEAVAHLHSLGVVHRDIKPGNVLVMEDGGLRLSDFGLVKSLNPSERSLGMVPDSSAGGVKGTLVYMAPEQERGERVNEAADTYALGVLLAELATGRRPQPRTAGGPGSALEGNALLKRLPAALQELIRQCTDRDPDRRPADAAAVKERFATLRKSLEAAEGAGG